MASGRVFCWFSAERLGRSMTVQENFIYFAETSGDGRQRLHFIDMEYLYVQVYSTEVRSFSSSTPRAPILMQQQ
jgi:hypothetical protein